MRLSGVVIACAIVMASCGPTHVGVGIAAGPPICPYGYYEVPPYTCAPAGYYGPEWFNGGLFIGAGPYYRGSDRFYGHVDHAFDYRHGYHGPFPQRGEAPRARPEFHGNAMHNPRGREAPRSVRR